jgi:alpha-beta hydrolase superfamily lysophospholipase
VSDTDTDTDTVAGAPTPGASCAPVPHASRPEPGFIGAPGAELFAWFHPALPAGGTVRDCAVVLVAPPGAESVLGHRALRCLADRVAATGFAVVRYDHPFAGDSAGDSAADSADESQRVAAWEAGIHVAADHARAASGASRVVLLGVRLGALLAARAAAERDDVAALVGWAPVVNGTRYAREMRFQGRLAPESDAAEIPPGAVSVMGQPITEPVLRAIEALALPASSAPPAPRALLVVRDDVRDESEALRDALAARGTRVELAQAAGYADAFTEAHKTRPPDAVAEVLTAWLAALDVPERADVVDDRGPAAAPARTLCASHDGRPVALEERTMRMDDDRLFGIVAAPVGSLQGRQGIVLANAGAVHRVGPHRVYVDLARLWAARGFAVLRMDLGGLGDSGAISGARENDPYAPGAVGDLLLASRALHAATGRPIIVGGLCSGAHAAFHAALGADDGLVGGLLLINPITWYWHEGDSLDVGSSQTFNDVRYYNSALRRGDAWLRLLRGQVNVFRVAAVFARRVTSVAASRVRALMRLLRGPLPEDVAADLARIAGRGVHVHLLFGDHEPGLDILRRTAPSALRRLARRGVLTLGLLGPGTHSFADLRGRRRLREESIRQLEARWRPR